MPDIELTDHYFLVSLETSIKYTKFHHYKAEGDPITRGIGKVLKLPPNVQNLIKEGDLIEFTQERAIKIIQHPTTYFIVSLHDIQGRVEGDNT